eukprot:4692545-Amphidinium_carterae.1
MRPLTRPLPTRMRPTLGHCLQDASIFWTLPREASIDATTAHMRASTDAATANMCASIDAATANE